jgi:hypothetical protein
MITESDAEPEAVTGRISLPNRSRASQRLRDRHRPLRLTCYECRGSSHTRWYGVRTKRSLPLPGSVPHELNVGATNIAGRRVSRRSPRGARRRASARNPARRRELVVNERGQFRFRPPPRVAISVAAAATPHRPDRSSYGPPAAGRLRLGCPPRLIVPHEPAGPGHPRSRTTSPGCTPRAPVRSRIPPCRDRGRPGRRPASEPARPP